MSPTYKVCACVSENHDTSLQGHNQLYKPVRIKTGQHKKVNPCTFKTRILLIKTIIKHT